MFRKILAVTALISVAGLAYYVSKNFDSEKISAMKEKLPGIGSFNVKESVVRQKEEVEERIASLATKIADAARELIERGSELASEKKQALLEVIEDAKKAIQEERERLKEIRARLDSSAQDNEVI